jgi:hypothetical protein
MNKSAPAHRWFSGWRASRVPAERDLADCGTAFGLDLSLPELRAEPAVPGVTKPRSGWMQRLATRRRPTA